MIRKTIRTTVSASRFQNGVLNSRRCCLPCANGNLNQYSQFRPLSFARKSTPIEHAYHADLCRIFSQQRYPCCSLQVIASLSPCSIDQTKRFTTEALRWRDEPSRTQIKVHSKWKRKTFNVPIGGDGSIALEVVTTVGSHSKPQVPARDILIFLPNLGQLRNVARDGPDEVEEFEEVLKTIALAGTENGMQHMPAPVIVKINHRLATPTGSASSSEDHRFPIPIHDVSVAFDWILENRQMLHFGTNSELSTISITNIEEQEPRILIYGSQIGGSLALMLALTQPNDIHAVVAHDPIVDWVGLDEIAASASKVPLIQNASKRRNKSDTEDVRRKAQYAAEALISLRTKLFRTPSGFFDAFASPLMFLRAPGRDTPLWRTARPELEEAQLDPFTEATIMQNDGGVQIDELETRELVHERGYGPYDDDWHTADSGPEVHDSGLEDINSPSLASTPDSEQVVTDLSSMSIRDHDDHSATQKVVTDLSKPQSRSIESMLSTPSPSPSGTASATQPMTDLTSLHPTSLNLESPSLTPEPPSARRRKVLRRWPPVGRPEDVELPYTMIYTTAPPTSPTEAEVDLSYVLHPQAKEMADVMSRACFWGREKSLGEEMVKLEVVSRNAGTEEAEKDDSSANGVVQRAVKWLREISAVEK